MLIQMVAYSWQAPCYRWKDQEHNTKQLVVQGSSSAAGESFVLCCQQLLGNLSGPLWRRRDRHVLKECIHTNVHAGGGLKERQAIYEQRRKQLGISAKRPRSTSAAEAKVKEESQDGASPEAPTVNPAVAAMMAKMGHKEGEVTCRRDIVHTCSMGSAGLLHVPGTARNQSRALRHRALCTPCGLPPQQRACHCLQAPTLAAAAYFWP